MPCMQGWLCTLNFVECVKRSRRPRSLTYNVVTCPSEGYTAGARKPELRNGRSPAVSSPCTANRKKRPSDFHHPHQCSNNPRRLRRHATQRSREWEVLPQQTTEAYSLVCYADRRTRKYKRGERARKNSIAQQPGHAPILYRPVRRSVVFESSLVV
ncbi:hypothetical protein MRX96_058970 [Rhipicephalus microplus]